MTSPNPALEKETEYVVVPREPTRAWAQKLAEQRQGQSTEPHCEPPTDVDVATAQAIIGFVLAARPDSGMVAVPKDLLERISACIEESNDLDLIIIGGDLRALLHRAGETK